MSTRLADVTAPPRPRPPAEADFGRVRQEVDAALGEFLDAQARDPADRCLPPLVGVLREFVRGGKRLRPLFCYCGWLAAGGDPSGGPVARAGAALELFHSFALIHDDVMDSSDTRRGRPTVHRQLAARYQGDDEPSAARFGVNAAILLGDLCLAWADEMLLTAGLGEDDLRRASPVLHAMRSEVMAGQYLDLAGEWTEDVLDRSWRALRLKTAGYTVERPLQIGAALAGGTPALLRWCSAYGRPLGEAFQLRDDLLGVFGEPGTTGKSVLDDLREGKQTVLMALTWRRAGPRQRAVIRELHGAPGLDEDGAARLRDVITATGAEDVVGELIEARAREARGALDSAGLPAVARRAFAELVHQAIRRTR
ncbi:polyprenyl synthetase family protein [Amycolatopsis endophytica]|uniref:Geranylgeranyl diphosphate synthase type I n=1 Tax=Amycolatopsis endophytica TaxID=860233 RepID=A0A853BB22_9PSEU|nr:polyprenyl synthetase family protein [Amycolatopsis endophytica]NYI92578.1 geranylgeranyl diphosphate synthase type I [Amycolatopsis endophytica]